MAAPHLRQRWRDRLNRCLRAKKLTGSDRAAEALGVGEKTVRRWLDYGLTPKPRIENIQKIAEVLDYPVVEQLADLGVIQDALTPWAFAGDTESPRLLLHRLWHAVDAVSATRPGVFELAQELLRSCEEEDVPGRWRSLLFDVPSGIAYPHRAYRGVEFELTPDSADQPLQDKTTTEWERTKEVWRRRSEPASWVPKRLAANSHDDDFRDHSFPEKAPEGIVSRDFALQRLELLHRLRTVLPHALGTWYGANGYLHRTLLRDRNTIIRRHIYLTRCYQERLPDPLERVSIPALEQIGMARVVLIGPRALNIIAVARILGEGLGWMAWDSRQLAGRITGRVPHPGSPERARCFTRAYQFLAEADSYRHAIIGICDLDTLLTPDGTLTSEAKSMLTAPDIFPIVLLPTLATLNAWRERTEDGLFGTEALWAINEPAEVDRALTRLQEFLQQRGATKKTADPAGNAGMRWGVFRIIIDLPWWPEEHPSVFEEPAIGDYRIRAAYCLAHYLYYGNLPGPTQGERQDISFADRSLLHKYQPKLRTDHRTARLLGQEA